MCFYWGWKSSKVQLKNIPNPPKGKSIKDIDVIINVENDSQQFIIILNYLTYNFNKYKLEII